MRKRDNTREETARKPIKNLLNEKKMKSLENGETSFGSKWVEKNLSGQKTEEFNCLQTVTKS